MQIYLVVFDQASFKLSEKLFQNVASYIDEHYVDLWGAAPRRPMEQRRPRRDDSQVCESATVMYSPAPKAAPKALS